MDDISIDYGLDPSGYLAGMAAITAGNTGMQQSMAGVVTSSTLMQRAMSAITPAKLGTAAMSGFALAAAHTQASMASLEASSSVTHVNVGKLSKGIKEMARDLPLGNDGAAALVTQFTKMGVASSGSESKIIKLSTTVAKLSGANGEAASGLADGMTNLARVTGNTNLDTKRYEALGDSLTTVANKSGASATGILNLAKTIAPMASASGIGATGVLGISSAFARLGEDGLGASTTVNKMLSDMNRSIRDGGPQVMAYANIVGKTADEFRNLFKANPVEAITQVTEALANAGSAGPRQLEMIGLDGVRAQRQLQGVIATGGLRKGIAEATEGYDSGSTEKASEHAFGGLNDSLGQLRDASSQVASALGTPLLAPLTLFSRGLTGAAGMLGKVAGNKLVQGALATVGTLAAGGLLAKTIVGGAATLGMGRQAATSGLVRSTFAGMAAARGDTGGWMAKWGAPAQKLAMSQVDRWGTGGQLGHALDKAGNTVLVEDKKTGEMVPKMRPTGNLERAAYNRMYGVGEAMGPMGPKGEMSTPARMLRGLGAYGGNLIQSYADSSRTNLQNQYGRNANDPTFRKDSFVASAGFKDAWAAAKAAPGANLGGEGLKAFHNSLVGVTASQQGLVKQSVTLTGVFGALTKAAFSATAMTGSLAKGGLMTGLRGVGAIAGSGMSALGRGLGSVTGMMGGGAGIALMAGMAGVGFYNKTQAQQAEKAKSFSESDINETLNTYREQAGQATKAVVTVASTGTEFAKSVAGLTQTMSQARVVTDETMAAGAATSGKKVKIYSGTPEQMAAQIAGLSVNGLAPSDISNAAIDLARGGRSKEDVQAVLNAIPKSAELADNPKVPTGSGAANLSAQIAPVIKQDGSHPYASGWRSVVSSSMSDLNEVSDRPGWVKAMSMSPGGGMHDSRLKEEDKKTLEGAVKTADQRRDIQGQAFSPEYAKQEQMTGFSTMMEDAAKSGDAESYLQLGKYISSSLTGKEQNLSPKMLFEHGGLGGALAFLDPEYAKKKEIDDKAAAAQPGGKFTADLKQSIDSKTLGPVKESYPGANDASPGIAPMMAKFFDYRDAKEGSPQAASMASSLLPNDLNALDAAVKAMTNTAGGSASALAELQGQAQAAAAGLTPGTPAYAQAVGVSQRAEAQKNYEYQDMKPSDILKTEIPRLRKKALDRSNTDLGDQNRKEGLAGLTAAESSFRQQANARISAQFATDTAKKYAGQDNTRARGYAKDDYTLQVSRTNRDFHKNELRAEEDFQLQLARSKEDFDISKLRTIRDFNITVEQTEEDSRISRRRANRDFEISTTQSQEDAAIGRSRAMRDFNINLKREIADSMSSMYDPYSRIQTKATWDAPNLLANIEEQTKAMEKQKRQLDELRKGGVSQKTIDFLGLGKTENAQQTTNTVEDLRTKPSVAKELNAATSKRAKATKGLVTDESNVALRRSTSDLNKNLSDQEKDLAKSLARGRKTLNKGLGDQAEDTAKSLARGRKMLNKNMGDQAADFERNLDRTNFSYQRSLVRNALDLGIALADMELQQTTSLDRQEAAFTLSIGRMDQALLDADKTVGQSFETLSETYQKAISGTAIDWQTVMTQDAAASIKVITDTLIPAIKKVWTDAGIDMPTPTQSQAASPSGGGSVIPGISLNSGPVSPSSSSKDMGTGATRLGKADGGPIPGYSPHPKADNIDIRATAGEFMQPVSTVNHYGVAGMEAIRQRRIPKEIINGYYDGGLISFGKELRKKGFQVGEHPAFGGVNPVHTPGSWHYRGGAIDVNHDQGNEKGAIDSILGSARKHHLRTLWQIKGHFDHAHFDIAKGPDMVGAGYAGGGAGGGSGGGESSVDTGVGGAISAAAIRKVMALAPKGRPFYTKILKQFENALVAKYVTAAAAATTSGPTTTNTNSALGKTMAATRGWTGANWSALNRLWTRESGWNNNAQNPTSTAYGIGQFLDSTWAGYGGPKTSDAGKQITYGMNYIKERYTDPVHALAKWNSRSPHWYDQGGDLAPGTHLVHNGTGQTEKVLTAEQWKAVSHLLTAEQGRTLGTSGGVHMTVHHNEVITYDNRVDLGAAKITVMSQDPDDMARQLERKAVAGRIGQTRGVRR